MKSGIIPYMENKDKLIPPVQEMVQQEPTVMNRRGFVKLFMARGLDSIAAGFGIASALQSFTKTRDTGQAIANFKPVTDIIGVPRELRAQLVAKANEESIDKLYSEHRDSFFKASGFFTIAVVTKFFAERLRNRL